MMDGFTTEAIRSVEVGILFMATVFGVGLLAIALTYPGEYTVRARVTFSAIGLSAALLGVYWLTGLIAP